MAQTRGISPRQAAALAKAREARQARALAAQAEEARPWSLEDEEPFEDEDAVEDENIPDIPHIPAEPTKNIAALRETLLQHLTAEERELISDDDLLRIKARQDKKAADERKKDVLEKLEADMLHRARVEQGLLSAKTLRTAEERARLAQKVRVKIEMPGSVLQQIQGFRIDGRMYEAGREYEMTRAEYESLRETHYRVHVNEIRFAVLDQDKKVGITLNNRTQGTTAAHALFAQAPVRLEAVDIDG